MSSLIWDASLETGDATVDAQHRTLLGMFNELRDCAIAGSDPCHVREILGRLVDYVGSHFADEQRLMIRTAFPPMEVTAHVLEHTRLTQRTHAMVADFESGRMQTVLPLCEFLSDWLGTHIRQSDKRLVAHVREWEARSTARPA